MKKTKRKSVPEKAESPKRKLPDARYPTGAETEEKHIEDDGEPIGANFA